MGVFFILVGFVVLNLFIAFITIAAIVSIFTPNSPILHYGTIDRIISIAYSIIGAGTLFYIWIIKWDSVMNMFRTAIS